MLALKCELAFKIPATLYRQILTWQQAIDLEIMCYQIERFGRAMVIKRGGEGRVQQVSQVPAPGEAQPYYGEIGGAYCYLFHPQCDGCVLRVENIVSGRVLFHPDPIPPLELFVPDPVELHTFPNGNQSFLKPDVGYIFVDNTQLEDGQVIFTITQDIYPRLAAWKRYGEPPAAYIFKFNPTLIGCFVHVEHIQTGEVLDVTRNVRW